MKIAIVTCLLAKGDMDIDAGHAAKVWNVISIDKGINS